MNCNEEYLFITTCSKTKSFDSDAPIPLVEMYTGVVFKSRYDLMKSLSEELYFCTPSGPGIVRDNWVTAPYNQMTPNEKLKSPEFQQYHRELFEKRYPGKIEKIKKIFWLGSEHYDEFLKNVFYDKEVIICIEKKLRAAILKSYLDKVHSAISESNFVPVKTTWIENGTHILAHNVKKDCTTGKNKTTIFRYKKVDGCIEEDFDYSITNFGEELFGCSREELKKMIINELNVDWKPLTTITCPYIMRLYEKRIGPCNTGDIPYKENKFNPFGRGILNKEFETFILNHINN